MKISNNFYYSEWTCGCGCGQCIVRPELVDIAETIRDIWDRPMVVHSVNRCKVHNKNEKGSKGSQHIKGKAIDFHIDRIDIKELHKRMLGMFRKGEIRNLGLYDWGVHVDIRKRKHFWDKRT